MTIRSLSCRKSEHFRGALSPRLPFHEALSKYGKESFCWEVLYESSDREDLIEHEKFFIKEMRSYGRSGYNMTPGGEGVIHTDEMKERKRALALGQHQDPVKRANWEEAVAKEDRSKLGAAMRHLRDDPEFYSRWHDACMATWTETRRVQSADRMRKMMEEKYGTVREREIHARAFRIARSLGKKWFLDFQRKNNKVPVLCVEDNILHASVKEAADFYKIDRRLISAVLHQRQHTASNRHFVYGEAPV